MMLCKVLVEVLRLLSRRREWLEAARMRRGNGFDPLDQARARREPRGEGGTRDWVGVGE